MFNFFILFVGFHYSRLTRKPVQWGLPFSVSIEPTTSCNLRCPQCPSGLREFTRPTGMLDPAFFEKAILQLKPSLHSLTFYFQGEPYLNPDFLSMVKTASSHNIYTITSTNGHYLNEKACEESIRSGLDRLVISVDGITQEVYEQYRIGGQLAKVIQGTREMLAWKKRMNSRTPHVVWQFVVFRSNEHQVELVKKLGRELGVDEVKIKTAQIYDFEHADALIPQNARLARYQKKEDGSYAIRNRMLNQCWRMWQGCVITWDGKVVPCCFDKDAKHQLGSLADTEFKDIWFSPGYSAFRQAILKGRSQIDICNNCTEGTQVWA